MTDAAGSPSTADVPPVWWSPSERMMFVQHFETVYDDEGNAVDAPPADAVRLVPAGGSAPADNEGVVRTLLNLDALIDWHEHDAPQDEAEFFRHDAYVLTIGDLRRSAAALRRQMFGAGGSAPAAAAEAEDGNAFFQTAWAEHGRCTCLPGDDDHCMEARCALCNALPTAWPCPTTEHRGYPGASDAVAGGSAPHQGATTDVTVPKPRVVTICGSMRFFDQMLQVAAEETVKGHIVLAPFSIVAPENQGSGVKARLDELHRRKIDMADSVIVVTNQDGYIGTSTKAEMVYAAQQGMTWDVREFHVEPAPVAEAAS